MKATLTLCGVQFKQVQNDKNANKQKIIELFDRHRPAADLMIFPEMTLTGFSMQAKESAESAAGETVSFFKQLAREYNAHIMFGMILQDGGDCYNTLNMVSPIEESCVAYKKNYLFSYAGENSFYSAGTDQIVVELRGFRIGLTICYDLRFPELYRKYARMGVDLLVNIANWPVPRIAHWDTLLKARAIENQCYMIGVNRCGGQDENDYNGHSAVIDPMGEMIAMGRENECIFTAEINLAVLHQVRKKFPFLGDIKRENR